MSSPGALLWAQTEPHGPSVPQGEGWEQVRAAPCRGPGTRVWAVGLRGALARDREPGPHAAWHRPAVERC